MRNYRNQPSGTVARARDLRKNATDAEKHLWRALRTSFPHAKFRRQVPLGPYFADFYCFAARLVIEVDGGQHDQEASYDAARTRFLEAQGLTVLRVWNNDVLTNTEAVIAEIASSLTPLSPREREGATQSRKGEGDTHLIPQAPSPSQG